MQFDEDVDATTLDSQHFEFGRRLEARYRSAWLAHGNDPDPDRPLRVGFVSADLRMHPVAAFLEPVLAAREAGAFDAIAYYTHPAIEETTRRLATRFDIWRHVHAANDDALAEQVRADGIDVLVDLSGHTAMNRLPVFARRPAPVQATWIGYPGTTGLTSVGYRITDASLDPDGLTDARHTERLLRLPGFNVPFITPPEAPPVNPLPALATGMPVLGCLNNPRKIGPRVVAAWARILREAAMARLLVGGVTDAALGEDLAGRFAAHGIEPARIEFAPRLASADYLALHHRIDLALDPFPYNGGTTSFHALWMGVPFVTLDGARTASRSGASILARAGLGGFVAEDEEDYVRKALAVLADLPSLERIRQSMRGRIAADAGNDARTVARRLEAAFREMWGAWCAARNSPGAAG
jgi:predicted O-linked N-acetylglucosamine transferase (SPINDLY family)